MRFTSGVELDDEVAGLFTWRNGKCAEARGGMSHAEAREAAGLREYAMSQENVGIGAGMRWYGRFPNPLREGPAMKRILVVVFATLVLALGLSAPASATIANDHASCAGLAAASRSGTPQAQRNVVFDVIGEAFTEGFPPGATFGGFAHFHDGSAEDCLD